MNSTPGLSVNRAPPGASWPRIAAARARAWIEVLFEGERLFDTIGVLTLLMVVLHLVSTPELREIVLLVAVIGLVDRRVRRRPEYWFALTGLFAVNHGLLWYALDNHKYLLGYWTLALGLARLQADSLRALAVNGRLLVGLCFLFATATKLLSPEYLDGSFFEFTLLTDRRFSGVSDLLGGVSGDAIDANVAAMRDLGRPYGALTSVELQDTPRIGVMAQVMTWWTIGIEGAIAVLFLLPERLRPARVRDAFLLLFLVSTYPVATVVGFGRILAIMGLAQTPNRLGVERAAYLAAFVLLPAYQFPFAAVLRPILHW